MANKHRRPPGAQLGGVDWDDIWPEVEDHLQRVLRFRLPAGSEPADVIQETAARIHRSGDSPACREEVLQLATRIAINISIDLQRRSHVVAWSMLAEDVRAPDDVEREVVARAMLSEICTQMSVTPEELERLLHCESAEDRTASAKSKRYRLRQRIRRIRDAFGGLVGIPKWRWLLGGVVATVSVVPPAVSLRLPSDVPTPSTALVSDATERHRPAPPVDGQTADVQSSELKGNGSTHRQSGQRSPTYNSQLKVQAPNGAGVEKGRREYPEGPPPHIACVRNIPPIPDTCLPHPLRD